MQGLSAFRVAHCCSSFSGRSPGASLAPNQQLLLLGFKQRSSFFKCGRKAYAPATRRLKIAVQDETASGDALPPLAEEEVLTNVAEEQVSTNVAEEGVSTNHAAVEEGPKVNVKFVLEKKCHYGQRFNVVGDNPLLGNWEVKAAIPMEWADGDIWTVELDVPANKQVEFKFLLTGESGEVEWQPGSNRVFNTVEGLVVNEAWESEDEAAAVEAGDVSSNSAEDAISSDTGGQLVPGDVSVVEDAASDEVVTATDGVARDEVVNALEFKADESNAHLNVSEPEPEKAPEVPVAELDVVATAVKSAVGVDNAA